MSENSAKESAVSDEKPFRCGEQGANAIIPTTPVQTKTADRKIREPTPRFRTRSISGGVGADCPAAHILLGWERGNARGYGALSVPRYGRASFSVYAIGSLKNTFTVSGDVTADINGNGQPRNVRWCFLDVDIKRGYSAAEALRAYPELVYLGEHSLFKLRVERLRMANVKVAAERLFREIRGVLEVASYPHSHHDRGAWI